MQGNKLTKQYCIVELQFGTTQRWVHDLFLVNNSGYALDRNLTVFKKKNRQDAKDAKKPGIYNYLLLPKHNLFASLAP